MATRTGAAHVVTTRRKYKNKVYETHLLRRSYRDGDKVKNETLGNLSHLPIEVIELVRRALRGETFVPATEAFEITQSRPHGHVQAITTAMQRLGFASLSRPSPAASAISSWPWWPRGFWRPPPSWPRRGGGTCTLAEEFGVSDADEDELYAAMDWLLKRQDTVQHKLVKRHLSAGSTVLYDLSSSYFEGTTCPLAKRGYSRDHRRDKLQVSYGLLTDARGCPLTLSVHEGNTSDSATFLPAVNQLREDFGLERMIMVGDRGMISSKTIDALSKTDGIDWVTALKSVSIRSLIDQKHLQLDLFDDSNLLEFSSPDYPDERLIACRNTPLARLRANKREELLCATERALEKIRVRVLAGKLQGKDTIGVKVGKVIDQYKVAKHIDLVIDDESFSFARNDGRIAHEAALDGLYIIRTSVPVTQMDSADCVRHYKSLANVERAFRSLKGIDLKVRPIHHRLENRVRAHLFLCMLAYYVEWHLREAWRELIFADVDQQAKTTRDPVAPAKRSAAAQRKSSTHRLDDETPAHSFANLLAELSSIVRNTCRTPGQDDDAPAFDLLTTPNAKQRQAMDLLQSISV